MLSCEGSSFAFAGAPRLQTKVSSSTGTKAVIFGGPTCVTSLSFPRSGASGSGGNNLAAAGGASYSGVPRSGNPIYTKNYAQDDTSIGVVEVTTSVVEGDTSNSGAAGDVGLEGGDADDEAMKWATSSNNVPTPEMTTDEDEARLLDDEQQQQLSLQSQKQEGEKRRSHSPHDPPVHQKCDETGSCTTNVPDGHCGDVVAPGGSVDGCVSSVSTSVSSTNTEGKDKNKKAFNSDIDMTAASMSVTLFLENLCEDNKAEPVLTSDFHSHRLPPMSVENYVDRITRYSHISGETLIVSFLLLLKYSYFVEHPVSIYNVHRLLITSVLLGAKLRDDVYYSNGYYSRIGGISNAEINKLEIRFCTQLEWDMWIDEQEYEMLVELLQRFLSETTSAAENVDEARKKEIQRRFWFEHLKPWKCYYENASSLRRERMRKNREEDQCGEREKGRLNPSQSPFPAQYPIGPYGNGRFVGEDQLILPAVFNRPTKGIVNSSHATVVTVPSGNMGTQQQQQQQQQRGVFDGNSDKFGILQRAVTSSSTTSVSFSEISADAKPYYYKSSHSSVGGYTASRHQPYRSLRGQNCANACSTTLNPNDNYMKNAYTNNSGNSFSAGSAGISLTTWRASGFHNSKRINTSTCEMAVSEQNNGKSDSCAGNSGPIPFPSHLSQSSGDPGEQTWAGGGKRGGKKRPKPDHYQDYR